MNPHLLIIDPKLLSPLRQPIVQNDTSPLETVLHPFPQRASDSLPPQRVHLRRLVWIHRCGRPLLLGGHAQQFYLHVFGQLADFIVRGYAVVRQVVCNQMYFVKSALFHGLCNRSLANILSLRGS